MKSNIYIYKHLIDARKKRAELKKELSSLDLKIFYLNKQCQHDIVFIVTDHCIHSVGIIKNYYCPICGKQESIYQGHDVSQTAFRKSRQIDLTKLQVANIDKALELIREEANKHVSIYYDEDNDVESLTARAYAVINQKNSTRTDEKKKILRNSAPRNSIVKGESR